MREISDKPLENRFLYHAPGPGARELHEKVSNMTLTMAKVVRDITNPSREQALTLTALEEVRMRWNQAVAMDGAGITAEER